MNFLIADSFTAAFNRLCGQDQKAVKAGVFDLQMDPSANALKLHRIERSKDPNFWSARVNRDVRLILHRTEASPLVAYVDHHDAAYAWAERRRIGSASEERRLLYVACTRAREHLLLTGVRPASEYLDVFLWPSAAQQIAEAPVTEKPA